AIVAWVAQLLDVVRPCFGFGLIILDRTVDQEEMTARLEHACRFADKSRWRTEMGCGDAAADQGELRVRMRKFFGSVLASRDSQPAFSRGISCFLKHRQSDIRERHFMSQRGEIKSGVAATRCDVQHTRLIWKRNGF